MKREDTPNGRFYLINGKRYPSVTTVLKSIGKGEGLNNWIAKVERDMVIDISGDYYRESFNLREMSKLKWCTTLEQRVGKKKASKKLLEEAADIGSQVHALIEWTIKARMCSKIGEAPIICDRARQAYTKFETWAHRVNFRPLLIEQTVWSEEYGYAGTMDLLAEVEGKVTVIDWKTGKRVYEEAHLQNAAYRNAVREMGILGLVSFPEPEQGIVVRLPKYAIEPDPDPVYCKDCFPVFLHAFETWKWLREMEEERQKSKVVQMQLEPEAKAV